MGVAIKQTLQILNDAKARGIAVFLITGRPEAQRPVTIENLEREGYHDWAGLTLKPSSSTLTTVAYPASATRRTTAASSRTPGAIAASGRRA